MPKAHAGITPELTPADIEALLEGDYSTWTKIWDFNAWPDNLTALGTNLFSGIISHEHIYIAYVDGNGDNRYIVFRLSDGTVTFASPTLTDYSDDRADITSVVRFSYMGFDYGWPFSLFGKYVVVRRPQATNPVFEVWKDGSLFWPSPQAAATVVGASRYNLACIRWDGKYIALVTDNDYLVLFEGS